MAGGPAAQPEGVLVISQRPPRRWNRGVWIRFALAISPTVVFAILGYRQSH
jgi:hypothetical protein